MGKAYKCDLTGEIIEGDGVKSFFVELPNLRLRIVPQRKISDKVFDNDGDLSPDSRKKIEMAIRSGLGIAAPAAEKAKASK